MKIMHRLSFWSSVEAKQELARYGVPVDDAGLVSVDIDEAICGLAELKELVVRLDALDIPYTTFTRKEVRDAHWLVMEPSGHQGYPQPEDEYLQVTYDLSDWCDKCGGGAIQRAPFRMTKEPKWGRRGIMQLNWVFDEYFVKPDIWAGVFKPHMIGCRPVLDKRGRELGTVVQLVPEGVVSVEPGRLEPAEVGVCLKCGRQKYSCVRRGRFPRLCVEPSSMMVRTEESFGSGSSSFKEVIVSQAIVHDLLAAKVRGVCFCPVETEG